MKIFFTDQQKHFERHLVELKDSNVIPYQRGLIKHKVHKQIIHNSFSDLFFSGFFDYKIFPTHILTALPQWIEENRTIQPGDTIVQQINIPPSSILSQRLIMGVRIKEVFNSDSCKGFSYETLTGHVEKGISTFKIEPQKNFSVFTIETHSAPGLAFLKLFQPFSTLYQDYCTNQALLNVSLMLTQ